MVRVGGWEKGGWVKEGRLISLEIKRAGRGSERAGRVASPVAAAVVARAGPGAGGGVKADASPSAALLQTPRS